MPRFTYCAVCIHRLSVLEDKRQNMQFLFCTNCGRTYSKDSEGKYRYLGITTGNNEIRELLKLEEI